jgi:hypothetical protein
MVNLNCGEGLDADIGTDCFYSPNEIEIIGEIRFRVDGSYQVYFPEARNPRPVYLGSNFFGLE